MVTQEIPDPTNICESLATVGEAGLTGQWRSLRPVIDESRCTPARRGKPSCFLCWLYCPEAVITKSVPVQIDLRYCKGCGVCAEECPTKAIDMVDEDRFRSARAEPAVTAERLRD